LYLQTQFQMQLGNTLNIMFLVIVFLQNIGGSISILTSYAVRI